MDEAEQPGEARFDSALGAWVLTSYADVSAALRDPRLSVSGTSADGDAAHAALREAAVHALSPARLAAWRAEAEASARVLTERLPAGVPVDLVGTFARPWSATLAVRATGAPHADAERLDRLARASNPACRANQQQGLPPYKDMQIIRADGFRMRLPAMGFRRNETPVRSILPVSAPCSAARPRASGSRSGPASPSSRADHRGPSSAWLSPRPRKTAIPRPRPRRASTGRRCRGRRRSRDPRCHCVMISRTSVDESYFGTGLEVPGPQGKVGLQPAEGLGPEPGPRRVVRRRVVLRLAAAGQGGGAGSVVAIGVSKRVGAPGIGGERLGVEAGRRAVEVLRHAHSGQCEAFGGVGRPGLALQDRRKLRIECKRTLGLTNPLGRGIPPVGPPRSELMTPAQ